MSPITVQLGIGSQEFVAIPATHWERVYEAQRCYKTAWAQNRRRCSLRKINAKRGFSFQGAAITSENYYETKIASGPRRLLEITEESAFWTGELAERMAALLRGVLVVALGTVVLAAFVALERGLTAKQIGLSGAHMYGY